MSKVEDLAKVLYPDWEMTGVSTIDGQEESMVRIQRVAYIKGYHQAEKDNELTWKNIRDIYDLAYNLRFPHKKQKEFFEEVLKRYKDLKK